MCVCGQAFIGCCFFRHFDFALVDLFIAQFIHLFIYRNKRNIWMKYMYVYENFESNQQTIWYMLQCWSIKSTQNQHHRCGTNWAGISRLWANFSSSSSSYFCILSLFRISKDIRRFRPITDSFELLIFREKKYTIQNMQREGEGTEGERPTDGLSIHISAKM